MDRAAFVSAEPPLTCAREPHADPRGGYLHEENDDRPFDVDGVAYCGRCHVALPHQTKADE